MKQATSLNEMERVAAYVQAALSAHTDKFDFAGSYRRKMVSCNDLEVVCIPDAACYNIFGEPEGRSRAFVEAVRTVATITKGNPITARYVQAVIHWGAKDIQLDLFMPSAHDYYRILALRTGPSAYSGQVLARAWVKNGWCGTEDGLRLQKECRRVGDKWVCQTGSPTLPPVWASEQDFFEWLGLAWVPAWQRA